MTTSLLTGLIKYKAYPCFFGKNEEYGIVSGNSLD